jgi:hypothetical protein
LNEIIQYDVEKKIEEFELLELQRMKDDLDCHEQSEWTYEEEIDYGGESDDEDDGPICYVRKCNDYATCGSMYCSLHKKQYDEKRKVIKKI